MEKLESDKTRAEEMNDKLLEEMEKRDKAVEEAVAMIVMLEANVAELTKERNMVRQVEAQGFYGSPPPKPRTENPPPDPSTLDVPQLDNEAKTINRMPSFLSDRSERTENLRNVYLGTRGSVLSLSRVAEASDMDNGQLNGLVSPTLSVLSESSFVSIYGQKGQEKMVPSKVDEPLSLDGTKASPPDTNAPILKEAPTQTPRSNSFSRVNSAGQFQPIASIMEGSPLQRIERLDPAYSQKRETPRPASSGKSPSSCELGKTPRSPGRKVTREEKREALRRVMTDTPGGVSLHDQALPPTPDTVASSTLRRFKNSNDTLDRRHDGMEGRSQDSLPSLPHLSVSNDKLSEPFPTIPTEPKAHPVQLGKQRDVPNDSPKRSLQAPPRPRSADESTVSHRRDTHPWDLDSDSDTDSFESSLDIWLRAGSKPPRGGRASPDLFGFPTNPSNGSWSMNAMFGPNNTYTGGANVNPDSDKMYDLFSAQQALFGTGGAPPPPNRRSSLNAQTGSNIPPADDATPKPPAKVKGQKPPGRRARHFRRNSDDAQMRANMKTPVPGQLAQPPPQPPANGDQKRSHYPPIAGHQGARNGLSRLFRRSLGGTPTNDATAHPPPPNPEPVNTEQPKNSHQPGAPTWVSRSGALDDDRSGATPPPIQRKPCQGRGSVSEVESYAPSTPGMDGTPATPVTAIAKEAHAPPVTQEQPESSPAAGSATGSRRKWLPAFGRSSSLKKSG